MNKKTPRNKYLRLLIGLLTLLLGILLVQQLHADIYFTTSDSGSDKVSRYNNDGTVINASFIATGLSSPYGLTIDTQGNIYVGNLGLQSIAKYDATGAPIATPLAAGYGPISLAINSGVLYHSSFSTSAINTYDPNSGALIKASFAGWSGGINNPRGIVVGAGMVYVANYGAGTVSKYTTEGVVVNPTFISGLNTPGGLALDAAGNLYVASFGSGTGGNQIGKYNATSGAAISASFITGLNGPINIALDGGSLYVTNYYAGTVGKYNLATGAPVNASFISVPGQHPVGLVVTPSVTTTTTPITTSGSIAQKVILYPANASTDLLATVTELQNKLHDITGAIFTTQTYTDNSGTAWPASAIVLGKGGHTTTGDDLLNISEIPDVWASSTYNAKGREHYILASTAPTGKSYIFIAGTTDAAISRGVYDFLQQLGCRWFFPGTDWKVTPSNSSLSWTTSCLVRTNPSTALTAGSGSLALSVATDETPDFKWRFIWMDYVNGSACADWNQNYYDYQDWAKTARIHMAYPDTTSTTPSKPGSFTMNALQDYGWPGVSGIAGWASAHSQWFNDYYPLVGGVRTGGQLGISNCGDELGIHTMVRNYVLDHFNTNPYDDMVTLEPNDNIVWCECAFCKEIQDQTDTVGNPAASVTNRVIYFGNAASAATPFPANKYITYYSYSTHCLPPTSGTDPQTGLTTNFRPSNPERTYLISSNGYSAGFNSVDMIQKWRALSPNLNFGVYDFLHVINIVPCPLGGQEATNINYATTGPAAYFNRHADTYTTESANDWGADGLGYYLMSKTLWKTTADGTAVKADFFSKAFGPAAVPMTAFYNRIDAANYSLFSADLFGRLYRDIQSARTLAAGNTNVLTRLDDLTLWVHYCELWLIWNNTPVGTARQTAGENLLKFAFQIRATNMMDCAGLFRTIKIVDSSFNWPATTTSGLKPYPVGNPTRLWDENVPYISPENGVAHPFKPTTAITPGDIAGYLSAGASSPLSLPEGPKTFSKDLVPSCRPTTGFTRGGVVNDYYSTWVYMYTDKTTNLLPQLVVETGYGYGYPASAIPGGPLYKTSDPSQIQLETQTVAKDTASHTLTFGSYGKGCYEFSYNDYGFISLFGPYPTGTDPALGKSVSYSASITEKSLLYGSSIGLFRYFYVPKGTKYVEIQGDVGGGMTFYNGNYVQKTNFSEEAVGSTPNYTRSSTDSTNQQGREIIIPVSNDDDQIWFVYGVLNFGNMYFVNIPGLIAKAPDELLIPREAYANLKIANQTAGTAGGNTTTQGTVHYYIFSDGSGNLPSLTVTNGAHISDWHLFKEKDDITGTPIAGNPTTVAANKTNFAVALTSGSATQNCYHLVYNDYLTTGGSTITWPTTAKIVMAANVCEPLPYLSTVNNSRRYFWVPKGTTYIQIKASSIGACNFYTAAGSTPKLAQPANSSNPVITIPVASGEDNQAWSIRSTGSGTNITATNLAFQNVPGYIAANSDQLLVPQWVNNQILGLW